MFVERIEVLEKRQKLESLSPEVQVAAIWCAWEASLPRRFGTCGSSLQTSSSCPCYTVQ